MDELLKLTNFIGFTSKRVNYGDCILLTFETKNNSYRITKYFYIKSGYDVIFHIFYKNIKDKKEYRISYKNCIDFLKNEFKTEIRKKKIEILFQ